MRISVDIDEAIVKDVMVLTGEKNKSPALAKAIVEFVRRRQAAKFGRLIRDGAFDYPDVSAERELVNPTPPLTEN